MRVTQDQWPLSERVVDVFVAIHIKEPGTLTTTEEERVGSAEGPEVAANAAGQPAGGRGMELAGFLELVFRQYACPFESCEEAAKVKYLSRIPMILLRASASVMEANGLIVTFSQIPMC